MKGLRIAINKMFYAFCFFVFPMAAFADTDELSAILDNAVSYAQSGPARGFCCPLTLKERGFSRYCFK